VYLNNDSLRGERKVVAALLGNRVAEEEGRERPFVMRAPPAPAPQTLLPPRRPPRPFQSRDAFSAVYLDC